MHSLLFASILWFFSASITAQTTWHVGRAGCDIPGSGAEEDPFCTIQEAVDAAANGDTVLVNAGTYVEDVFVPALSITLSGRGGAEQTIIESASLAAITLSPGSNVLLEGLTLTRSGIYCRQARAKIRDCRFVGVGQYMGGGIWTEHSELDVVDCLFDGAVAGNGGGAIASLGDKLRITDCEFVGQPLAFPEWAGALLLEDSDTAVSGCSFVGYRVLYWASAILLQGGTLDLEGSTFLDNLVGCFSGAVKILDANAKIRDCTFAYNISDLGWGGAIHIDSGPGFEVNIADCLFEKNDAAEGGAICVHAGILTLDRCQFFGNSTGASSYLEHGYGGALLVGGLGTPGAGVAYASRCVFVGNSAYGHYKYSDGRGGAVHGPVLLENCTLFRNRVWGSFGDGPRGGAASGSATLLNCIVWDNELGRLRRPHRAAGPDEADQVDQLGPTVLADWSVVQGGWPGTGNLNLDPEFTQPHRGDFHLRPLSPCIDSGDPSQLDEDGSRIDMGAHAFDPRQYPPQRKKSP